MLKHQLNSISRIQPIYKCSIVQWFCLPLYTFPRSPCDFFTFLMGVLRETMGKFKHKSKNRVTNDGHKQDVCLFVLCYWKTKKSDHERKWGLMLSFPSPSRKVSVHRIWIPGTPLHNTVSCHNTVTNREKKFIIIIHMEVHISNCQITYLIFYILYIMSLWVIWVTPWAGYCY